uniref:Uncharacterized protein n=1 Tax=Anguilla anguilla TaxID=7936 RepID=A0A0E9Q1N6_ANGAN
MPAPVSFQLTLERDSSDVAFKNI